MKLYQQSHIKQSRKAIKQCKRNCLQNFNWLKLRFNQLFMAVAKTELKQTVYKECERERERYYSTNLY